MTRCRQQNSDHALALVGIGKIARAQHLPALRADAGYELAAAVSQHSTVEGTQTFSSLDALLRSDRRVDAVSLCTPPVGRHELACAAIDAGLHVMLEKPPGATVAEVLELEQRARRAGVSLFASWHSREAAGRRARARVARDATHPSRSARRGRKTFACGIRGRTGSSKPAASACSIPASTAFRS